jgi:hypothetical protein
MKAPHREEEVKMRWSFAKDAHQLHNESSTQRRRGEDAMEFCKGCTPAAQLKSSTGRG